MSTVHLQAANYGNTMRRIDRGVRGGKIIGETAVDRNKGELDRLLQTKFKWKQFYISNRVSSMSWLVPKFRSHYAFKKNSIAHLSNLTHIHYT